MTLCGLGTDTDTAFNPQPQPWFKNHLTIHK